jgi:SAM-dependent methyltransferase
MTTTTAAAEADAALKDRHRTMWALGDYPALADEVISGLGARLVEAAGVRAGQQVLDVAAGSGNASIPAALTGAAVIASDLVPDLLAAGRARAAARGAQLDWEVADAEALPWAARSFDVVLSCLGVMFAPHQEVAAAELVRVCRPDGRIALLNWTPSGFIGRMFATMKPYAPPPPPGAQPPPRWGDEQHVRGLFGEAVEVLDVRTESVRVACFDDPVDFREYFKARYGPTIAVYRGLTEDPTRAAALDAELEALATDADCGEESFIMNWEYQILIARRRW